MRPYFSNYHIQSAVILAKQSAIVERDYSGNPWEEIAAAVAEHKGYTTGAIFAAVAFLEAAINELFVDAVDHEAKDPKPASTDPPMSVHQLPPATRKLLANVWPLGTDRFETLAKYQTALVLNGKPEFDTSANPYQDARDLISLRNDLIHYSPRDIPAGLDPQQETEKMARRLRAKDFATNALLPAGSGNPFYPDKCLGRGCAKWAVNAVLEFADEFFSRMEITPRYDRLRGSFANAKRRRERFMPPAPGGAASTGSSPRRSSPPRSRAASGSPC